jgi:hypothetical protein
MAVKPNRGTRKHERDAVRRLERLTPGLRVRIEARASPGHKWLVASIGALTVRVTIASSPSCAEHAFNHMRQQCWRALREQGVAL